MSRTVSVVDPEIRELATAAPVTLYRRLSSSPKGLTEHEAASRSVPHTAERRERDRARWFRSTVASPFAALLTVLAVVFVVLGDGRAAVTVGAMVVLSIALRVWQQVRSDQAVRGLRALVTTTTTVRRRPEAGIAPADREIPPDDLVPGDVVLLMAGDVVPADVRLVSATALTVDQSALSGEALPVRKQPPSGHAEDDMAAVCFAGTSVVSGTATAVVVAVGARTYLGVMGEQARYARPESSFDRGVRSVGWTLVRFMLVMAPIVLAVNGFVTGDWAQAALFAVAVAVGLTPEMLPVIVTANLARGAVQLSRKKVVITRLNAIQDLAGMDVLCVDKTGTLTEDRVTYAHSVDLAGRPDGEAAEHAYLAAHFQTGPRNRLDEAIVDQLAGDDEPLLTDAMFALVDEIGFDHTRRRTTVVVRQQPGEHLLITKGDPDEILPRCTHAWQEGDVVELTGPRRDQAQDVVRAYSDHGMRVLAVAARQLPARLDGYDETDEANLVLVGFVGFVDPVRDSAAEAVRMLDRHGVAVKILTGDNRHVAARVAEQVGVPVGDIVVGHQVEKANDAQLRRLVQHTTVFAQINPVHKARIVTALRDVGHAVGFIGDGVNDTVALRTADVGIAADTATDVAKDAADLILLAKDLTVIAGAVLEGRRTLGNTMKYVKITASSNLGNVVSVLVAAATLPFLPMLPIQLMVQNLLYDAAQLTLPWDKVDEDYLREPRRWGTGGLTRFMLTFGPLSSLFDVITFAGLWWLVGTDTPAEQAMFQAGWFTEGLLSQVLIVLVLRSRHRVGIPARPVLAAAVAVAFVGLVLPWTPVADALRMTALPLGFYAWLPVVLVGYALAAQAVKARHLRHRGPWL
ncbi:magnesium-translocating P-type ATPase [Actinosynnema sp. ALI-1.44]|uniref:magnesium-translocating P-type ATPase n=1 Tax=Actinosynnema sp. ALI-1.44 TaxID=1933779 RepID=UPI00097BAE77|nr:magnesium-translocating P-type ATPase [Actinosynnema sp. ALI-1.44]ONI81559.1 magnesium-translocating P-type ATPase [Actinosynnema sp. ALI-1.44]